VDKIDRMKEKLPDYVTWEYSNWKRSALYRGIDVRLSMAEWWAAWAPHWNHRRELNLIMARHCGIGSYSAGNILITTQGEHARSLGEFRRFMARRAAKNENQSSICG